MAQLGTTAGGNLGGAAMGTMQIRIPYQGDADHAVERVREAIGGDSGDKIEVSPLEGCLYVVDLERAEASAALDRIREAAVPTVRASKQAMIVFAQDRQRLAEDHRKRGEHVARRAVGPGMSTQAGEAETASTSGPATSSTGSSSRAVGASAPASKGWSVVPASRWFGSLGWSVGLAGTVISVIGAIIWANANPVLECRESLFGGITCDESANVGGGFVFAISGLAVSLFWAVVFVGFYKLSRAVEQIADRQGQEI